MWGYANFLHLNKNLGIRNAEHMPLRQDSYMCLLGAAGHMPLASSKYHAWASTTISPDRYLYLA